MRFNALNRILDGEVWSAGPLTNTVWARADGEWYVVDIKTKRAVDYIMPVFMSPQPRERVEWAEQVLKSRRHNPLPDDFVDFCDPERDIAHAIWTIAIAQDRTTAAIHATRYADRASVSAKRLMELDKS
ncbi:hypothetical protein [Nocardia jiangxiensis]|uniref:hypothetical protein n=1 Tax=Nocardia jiangxiensis TaxID=282685 RepID=UPI0002DFB61E|nr:hypothetical protein [Nocardia jiangxiensis]